MNRVSERLSKAWNGFWYRPHSELELATYRPLPRGRPDRVWLLDVSAAGGYVRVLQRRAAARADEEGPGRQ